MNRIIRSRLTPRSRNFRDAGRDSAVSTVIGVVLILGLTVLLAAIITGILFGYISMVKQKSAYIVADARYTNNNGNPTIILSHLQGDTGHLSGSGPGYPLMITISSGSSSGEATPASPGLVWSPGTNLYVVKTYSGYRVSANTSQYSGTIVPFPGNEIRVSVINTDQNILVYTKTFTINGPLLNITPTPAPTPYIRGPGFSVLGWIRFTSSPVPQSNAYRWATMVADGDTDANQRYMMQHNMDNTKFEFSFKTKNMEMNGQRATYVWSTSGPIQNNWYFLAGVYNQSDGKTRIYVNGVLETTHWMTDTSGMASSPGKYQLGGPDGVFYGGYYRGRLPGDVRGVSIVEQAVLQPELVTLYQSGPP